MSVVSYARKAGREQGIDEHTVRREIARGEAIPVVARLAGTSLDKPEELDALARLGGKFSVKSVEIIDVEPAIGKINSGSDDHRRGNVATRPSIEVPKRRLSPIAAHSRDRLLSEPTADT
jgi:hypothetical protein